MAASRKGVMPRRYKQSGAWLTKLIWTFMLVNTFLDSSSADDSKTHLENLLGHIDSSGVTDARSIVPSAWNGNLPAINSFTEHSFQIDAISRQRMLADIYVISRTIAPSLRVHERISIESVPTPGPGSTSFPPNGAPSKNFTCGICGDSYIAGIGDFLSSVATYCNVSYAELTQLNPNLPSSGVLVENTTAQTIVIVQIPCTNSSVGWCTRCGASYIINSGDTLDLLSKSCNLTLKEVERANPDIDYSNVYPGQYISIPCYGENVITPLQGCGPCGISYTVRQDGSISNVSKQCETSVDQLRNANPAVNSSGLVLAGQVLRVPCSGNSPSNCGLCGNTYFTDVNDGSMSIPAKCRVGYIEIEKMNPSIDFNYFPVGTETAVPCDSLPVRQVCSKCYPTFNVSSPLDISSIAGMCNVSSEFIAYANNLTFSGVVSGGQILSIPCASLPSRNSRNCGTCGSTITLQSQVPLEAIAGVCSTTIEAIREENGNFTFDTLGPKDEIALPCNYPDFGCGPCGIGYTVAAGDTLPSVAVKCATMANEIEAANPFINFEQLITDNTINIPCTGPRLTRAANSGGSLRPLSPICFWCHDTTPQHMYSILVVLGLSVLVM